MKSWNSCPVCGASPNKKGNCKPKKQDYVDEELGNYYIWCDNCGLRGPYGDDQTHSIELWNSLLFDKQTL